MKFFIKLLVFFIFIILIQHKIGDSTHISFDKLDELNRHINNADILFFGSSVNWYTDKDDKDKRSISQILDSLQYNNVHGISSGGYHLEIFSDFFKYMIDNECSNQKLIIFEVNLRSFSPEWNNRPTYQFKKESHILNNDLIINFEKPLSVFKYNFNRITERKFKNVPVYKGKEQVGFVKDYVSIESTDSIEYLKMNFLFHYLYSLDNNHKKIKAIQKIIELAKQNNIKVFFFITPIDYMSGSRNIPDDFISLTSKNVSFIEDIFTINGVGYIDLSYSLATDYFTYKKVPNEHLKDKGRFFVAKEINNWITDNIK